MKESSKYNVRYVGFESLPDGGRRVDYAITAQATPARSASIHVPASAFTGPNRLTFQEIATIGCEKIRHELETQPEIQITGCVTLSAEEIEEFRPRKRAAGKRS
jgi:hypothetical protein